VENVFLTFEVEIDSAVGDASLARDIRDLRVEVAVMREDTNRSAQDGLTFIS
jgi:hypothetical protein